MWPLREQENYIIINGVYPVPLHSSLSKYTVLVLAYLSQLQCITRTGTDSDVLLHGIGDVNG